MSTRYEKEPLASVALYWLPLGAGGRCVRLNGRVFEALAACHDRRPRYDLYHSALQVAVAGDRFAIEMAPVWNTAEPQRGAVGTGPVGTPWLGRFRLFRYEVRRWRGGSIPDLAEAVASPQRLVTDEHRVRRLLELAPAFPMATWGADEQRTGDMWNSNSLISWLLVRSGHDLGSVRLPARGRAPGWSAGAVVAARQLPRPVSVAVSAGGRPSPEQERQRHPGDDQSDPAGDQQQRGEPADGGELGAGGGVDVHPG